jgi:hypothetical protein
VDVDGSFETVVECRWEKDDRLTMRRIICVGLRMVMWRRSCTIFKGVCVLPIRDDDAWRSRMALHGGIQQYYLEQQVSL